MGDVAFVGASAFVLGAFDLDALHAAVVFDQEVVGGGVSPGAGDDEAVLGGAGGEAKFGPFAAEFAVLDCDFVNGNLMVRDDFHFYESETKKGAALVGPRLDIFYLLPA